MFILKAQLRLSSGFSEILFYISILCFLEKYIADLTKPDVAARIKYETSTAFRLDTNKKTKDDVPIQSFRKLNVDWAFCKGSSIIITIYAYDNFYRKREGGGWKMMINIITEFFSKSVRGGRGSESYDRNCHKWKWWKWWTAPDTCQHINCVGDSSYPHSEAFDWAMDNLCSTPGQEW